MRIHRITLGVASAALAISAGACKNDKITNINKDPNNPLTAPPGAVFTDATETAVSRWQGQTADLRSTEFIIQHQTEDQYSDEDRYVRIDPVTTQTIFNGAYSHELADFQRVIQQGTAASEPGIYGPAMVMRALEFKYLTDSWGSIPYSTALKGDSGVFQPTYDTQQSIYTDLFKQLLKAATDMNQDANATASLGSNDPIYKGDDLEWAKFANSLHARAAMQILNVAPATANTELTAAFHGPGGVFTSNADNALLVWPGDGVFDNPWSTFFSTRDDNRMSAQFINILISLADPRLLVFAQPATQSLADCQAHTTANPLGKCQVPTTAPLDTVTVRDTVIGGQHYYGEPNGLATSLAVTWSPSSRVGVRWFPGTTTYGTFGTSAGKKAPSYLMTFAELSFIQAEAANRGIGGLNPGQAAAFYNAGVTASMNQWGINDGTAIAAYLAQPSVAYTADAAGLAKIQLQEYIALNSDGVATWALWRRTCVPSTVQAGPNTIQSTVARRFQYPTIEYSVNPTNVAAAVTSLGATDAFTTHVWWDVLPTHTAPNCGGQ